VSIPLHVQFRRKLKVVVGESLRFFSPKPSLHPIVSKDIKSILIIRINYRIGNMLFTTPLIQQVQRDFPSVKIDVLIGAPFTKSLFNGFKNIENIYDFPRSLLKHPIKLFQYVKQLRSEKYDVVLNLNGNSSSDRLATLLAKSTYKVAFCNDTTFTPVNRCVQREDLEINHEALKPLELMKIFNLSPDYEFKLSIALSEKELQWGKAELLKLINRESGKVFAIFRNARFDKLIDDEYWQNLIESLKKRDEEITIIDILSPDVPVKLSNEVLEYSQKDLRKLAAFMANLDAFICGDTGPMHLASASGVPTVALFKTTAPTLYGTLKERDISLEIKNKSAQNVAVEILNHLKL